MKSFFHILGAGRLEQKPPASLIFLLSLHSAYNWNAEKAFHNVLSNKMLLFLLQACVIVVSCHSYCSHCDNFGKIAFTCA